jgi:hypothetical protein
MINLNTDKDMISIMSGSSGRLSPRPPPILSTLMESGTRKHSMNNKVSRLKRMRSAKSKAKGKRLSHIKSNAMAVIFRPMKPAQSR